MPSFTQSILTLDGGGIRGIISCLLLQTIEERTGKRTAELFDLVAGTSTGGILASGLVVPDEEGRPRYRADDLLELYRGEMGSRIFEPPGFGVMPKARLLWNTLFSDRNIEEILNDLFGDTRLSEAVVPMLITAYNTQEKKPFYFRSTEAAEEPAEDFLLREIARATSAAPTYFPPKHLKYNGRYRDQTLEDVCLIDGGVFANNPSVLAFVEAMQLWKSTPGYQAHFADESQPAVTSRGMEATVQPDNFAPPFLLVSIGTGHTRKCYQYEDIRRWGVQWLLPIIDILMQGVSESVHYQMQHLLPPYRDADQITHPRYYRFNIEIDPEYSEMSDVSDKTRQRLVDYGREMVDQYSEEIDRVCNLLMDLYERREPSPRRLSSTS